MAANPPDFRTSYSGSALPFASKDQAFEESPNIGKVTIVNSKFTIKVLFPNSYMIGLGSVLIPPTVYLQYITTKDNEVHNFSIQVSNGIPYRTLTYPLAGGCARQQSVFYSNHHCLPIRKNQEEILRQSAYPQRNIEPSNFWGDKPSL
jgi:hypothetical protein